MNIDPKKSSQAWENYETLAESDRGLALANLYSELTELGCEEAHEVGLVGIETLMSQQDFNQACQLARSLACRFLDVGKVSEALDSLNHLTPNLIWLNSFELGMFHYARGEVFVAAEQLTHARDDYKKAAEALETGYAKSYGHSLVELARTEAELENTNEALRNLAVAVDIFSELHEVGMVGYLRKLQGSLLRVSGDIKMSRKLLTEAKSLLEFAEWGKEANQCVVEIAILDLLIGRSDCTLSALSSIAADRSNNDSIATAALAEFVVQTAYSIQTGSPNTSAFTRLATVLETTGYPKLAEELESEILNGPIQSDSLLALLKSNF